MDETLKQFPAELAQKLKAKIESPEFASFIEKVNKASGDDRSFEVVMSTSDEDRQGDALDQSGWDFKYFDMNPVLLWAHNYQGFPIGVVTDLEIKGNETVATGKFAPAGLNPEADLACALYREKILRAVSPGYIQNDDGTRELLEVSFCPVPAGRYALSLRQVRSLGMSTRELISKGFFYKTESPPEKKDTEDDPVIGDPCQLDDGTPGVLAKDPKNPDRLVCVPPEGGKSQKPNETQENMNDELQKKLKAEHERHGETVMKAIEELSEKAMKPEDDEEKAAKEGDSEIAKAIDEFSEKMDGEQEGHLEKCMKAVDEAYDIDPEEKKSIDEFKKAIEDEHLKHVKAFDKAIEEFKGEAIDPEKCEKATEEFTAKAEDELDRHEQAHVDMAKAEFGEGQDDGKSEKQQKGAVAEEMQEDAEMTAKYKRIDKAYSVFSAFISAYLDEKVAVEDYDKLLDEAVALMKNTETKSFPNSTIRPLIGKSGRSISAKTKEKIDAVIKAVEKHRADHAADTDTTIAALKELKGSPQGDEGKDDAEEKSSHTPKPRSSPPRAALNTDAEIDISKMSEFEAFMFTRKLLRAVNSESGKRLSELNEVFRKKFPDIR